MDPISLRVFRFPEDYTAARHLWENAGSGIHLRRSDEPEEIRKKLLRDPDLFLVAEDGKMLVGTVMGGFDGRRGMVYHLAVAAEYRSRGIGNLLMEALEERLRQKGCIRCYLLVTRDNETALKFYERRGWEKMDQVYIYGKELE
jgi:N-acetylglutamate synthase